MKAWRASGVGRHVCLNAKASRGCAEPRPDLFVLPAWNDAGLSGEPEFEVWLTREDGSTIKVYLTSADSRALIAFAHAEESGHWLDGLEIHFTPSSPSYVLVDGAGRWVERTASLDETSGR